MKTTLGYRNTVVKQHIDLTLGGYDNHTDYRHFTHGLFTNISANRLLIDKGESKISLNFGFRLWSDFNQTITTEQGLYDINKNRFESSITVYTKARLNPTYLIGLNFDYEFEKIVAGLSLNLIDRRGKAPNFKYVVEDYLTIEDTYAIGGHILEIGTHFIF